MTLALDTNVFVDLIRGRKAIIRQRRDKAILAGEGLVTSLIVYHELQFGVALSRDPAGEALNVAEVLEEVIIEPLNEDDVTAAALVRAKLKPRGSPVGPYDVLIAGQALARGWTLVTSNAAEFARVEGLEIQDWSQP
ncbi:MULTISPECIES: PIN domain-containing protein [unclassified Caulobacter]|uniref:PIN domain-containing protein n=1 Tax=unclassified Caulobacter TaxID=2648921 RepID=UPI000ABF3A1F|nr:MULTISPECIES: PIN domain-containing protein [unclassified Caulobacter]